MEGDEKELRGECGGCEYRFGPLAVAHLEIAKTPGLVIPPLAELREMEAKSRVCLSVLELAQKSTPGRRIDETCLTCKIDDSVIQEGALEGFRSFAELVWKFERLELVDSGQAAGKKRDDKGFGWRITKEITN